LGLWLCFTNSFGFIIHCTYVGVFYGTGRCFFNAYIGIFIDSGTDICYYWVCNLVRYGGVLSVMHFYLSPALNAINHLEKGFFACDFFNKKLFNGLGFRFS
jgi:hypothetical protein